MSPLATLGLEVAAVWCAYGAFIVTLGKAEDADLPADARRRARELFFAQLDPKQRRSWRTRRKFDAVAPSGRRYTISTYRPFNIRSRDALYCVQVDAPIPVYDKLLAQKLLIEADETLFLASANARFPARP